MKYQKHTTKVKANQRRSVPELYKIWRTCRIL